MSRGALLSGYREEILLPAGERWELYHNSFSLCSKKVRVCLAELGISYKSHPIDLIETGRYQNVSREFLRVNPAGTVPVLLYEGHPIYESHEQIRFAADHVAAKGPALVPDDPQKRELVELWTDKASLVGDPMSGHACASRTLYSRSNLPAFCDDGRLHSGMGNREGPAHAS